MPARTARRSPRDRRRGFNLMEVCVVVMLVAIIAVMAIPSLFSATKTANEASAISGLRAIVTSCEFFKLRHDIYPGSLLALAAGGYLEGPLGTGHKSGYHFGAFNGGGDGNLGGTIASWSCFAEPATPGQTGDRCFKSDQTGAILESSDAGVTWIPLK